MNDDAALLRRYAEEKSEAAFADLVRRHLDLVYSAALRRLAGDSHLAADVAQQVFTALARDAGKLSRHRVLTAWLYTATRNAAIDLMRSEQSRRAREQEAFLMQTSLAAPPDADWEKLRPVLDEVMDELPDTDRTAVLLRYFARRPFGEIGRALDLSADAARMRVDRALEKLRTRLAQRGVTSSTAALGLVLSTEAVVAAPVQLAANATAAAVSSAAFAAPAAGLISFMSTAKCGWVITVAAFLALAGAFREFAQAREVKAEVDSLRARQEELARVMPNAVREAGAAGPATPPLTAPAALPPPPADEPMVESPEANAGRAFLDAHPDLRPLLERSVRGRITALYWAFYRDLGLADDQIDRFEEIMSAGFGHFMPHPETDVRMLLAATPALPAAEKERRLRELIGDDGFQRLGQYQKMQDSNYVYKLASLLYFTEPLAAEQGRQFARAVRAARERMPWGTVPPREFWAPLREEARTFFTTAQLAALDGLQAEDELQWASRRRNSTPAPAQAK